MYRVGEIKIWRQLFNMNSNFKLIPYMTYSDPDEAGTAALVAACFDNGADVIELGMPFSDPIADGPVIQASHQRALTNNPGITLTHLLNFIRATKLKYAKPILIMCAVNLIIQYGIEAFFLSAKTHGVDGLVIPDLPIEEAKDFLAAAKKSGVPLSLLISPLCSHERITPIIQASQGFIYLISSTGITGVRNSVNTSLDKFANTLKSKRNLPIYVGFGISNADDIAAIKKFADGAIVGSHLVKIIEDSIDDIPAAAKKIGIAINGLKQAC